MKEQAQTAVAVIIILLLAIIAFVVIYQFVEYQRFKEALVHAFNPSLDTGSTGSLSGGPGVNSPNWDAYMTCLSDPSTTLQQCQERYPS